MRKRKILKMIEEDYKEDYIRVRAILLNRQHQWQNITREEALKLWQLCSLPTHLETEQDKIFNFAFALNCLQREKNFNALCSDENETENSV